MLGKPIYVYSSFAGDQLWSYFGEIMVILCVILTIFSQKCSWYVFFGHVASFGSGFWVRIVFLSLNITNIWPPLPPEMSQTGVVCHETFSPILEKVDTFSWDIGQKFWPKSDTKWLDLYMYFPGSCPLWEAITVKFKVNSRSILRTLNLEILSHISRYGPDFLSSGIKWWTHSGYASEYLVLLVNHMVRAECGCHMVWHCNCHKLPSMNFTWISRPNLHAFACFMTNYAE